MSYIRGFTVMSSGQGLVLNGQQAITSTNDDQVSLSDMISLGHYEYCLHNSGKFERKNVIEFAIELMSQTDLKKKKRKKKETEF